MTAVAAGGCFANPGLSGGLKKLLGMAQNFIGCDREQLLLMSPSLREWLPENDLAWFVIEAVGDMDLSRPSMRVIARTAGVVRLMTRR
jgi:hypothetical protein